MAKLDLDTFGEVMNGFIKENKVTMLVTLPEGSDDPVIKDNIKMGCVPQFYILTKAIVPIFMEIYDRILDHSRWEEFVDKTLEMVKEEIAEKVQEKEGGVK